MNTRAQVMGALAQANHVRITRAQIKREIASGELTVAEVLRDVPIELAGMALADLLRARKGLGRYRVVKFCQSIPIPEHRKLGSLAHWQVAAIVRALERRE